MTRKTFHKLVDQRDRLTMKIEEEIRGAFPIGSIVHWMLGTHDQGGTVLEAYCERLKVRNAPTGKEFWIAMYRVEDW